LEGQVAVEHEVEYDAQTEGVDAFVVLPGFVDFWGDEAGGACELLPGRQVFQFVFEYAEAEVDEFDASDCLLVFGGDDLGGGGGTMTFSGLRSRWMMPDSLR
jgi:hypothetical protein